MIKPVEKIKKDCGKASTFQWVLNTLGYNFPFDTAKCKVIFTTLVQILTELDKKVLATQTVNVILEEMDKWIELDVSDVSLLEEWTRHTIAILRDDSPYNPIFDPFLNNFDVLIHY